MQFTICGFQQKELLRLGLDHTDAIILRYIVDFFHNGGMYQRVDDNKVWFWFSYANVRNDLPCMGIKSEKHVAALMRKWAEAGIIEKKVIKGKDDFLHEGKKKSRVGTWTYFHFVEKAMTKLTTAEKKAPNGNGVPENAQHGCGETGTPDAGNPATKDPSSTDPSPKDPSTTGGAPSGEIIFADDSWIYYSDETASYMGEERISIRTRMSLPPQVQTWLDNKHRQKPYQEKARR